MDMCAVIDIGSADNLISNNHFYTSNNETGKITRENNDDVSFLLQFPQRIN